MHNNILVINLSSDEQNTNLRFEFIKELNIIFLSHTHKHVFSSKANSNFVPHQVDFFQKQLNN